MPEIWQMTATRLAAEVREKRLSAIQVTQAHLDRLASVNPAINAVVQEFPEEALEAARQVDATVARGRIRVRSAVCR